MKIKLYTYCILGVIFVITACQPLQDVTQVETSVSTPPLSSISLEVSLIHSIPKDCFQEETMGFDKSFYTCPQESELAGLWVVSLTNQFTPTLIASPEFIEPDAIISPDNNYLAFRQNVSTIYVVDTKGWQTVVEINVATLPPLIRYLWLPDSTGMIVTYPDTQSPLGIVYLTNKRETIVSQESYNNVNYLHPDGGIRFFGYRQNKFFYTLRDLNNHPPQYRETYFYDIETKQTVLLYRDNTSIFIKDIFNFVNDKEIIVSMASLEHQDDILGYYRIHLDNHEAKLINIGEVVSGLKIIGNDLEGNAISVITQMGQHKIINLENKQVTETTIKCDEFIHTKWSKQNNFILVFCQDKVWLFNTQTKEVNIIYHQTLDFPPLYGYRIDELYKPDQQLFVLSRLKDILLLSIK